MRKRKRLIAMILSFLVPGLGQIYCGRYRRGFGWFFLFLGFVAGALVYRTPFLIPPSLIVLIFCIRDAYRLGRSK